MVVLAAHRAALPVEDHHRRSAASALPTGATERVWREGSGVDGRGGHAVGLPRTEDGRRLKGVAVDKAVRGRAAHRDVGAPSRARWLLDELDHQAVLPVAFVCDALALECRCSPPPCARACCRARAGSEHLLTFPHSSRRCAWDLAGRPLSSAVNTLRHRIVRAVAFCPPRRPTGAFRPAA